MRRAYARGTGSSGFVPPSPPHPLMIILPVSLCVLQVNGKDAVSLEHEKVVDLIKGW